MMADSRRYGLTAQLDIKQILMEAQHRWLRPAEICEILRNYRNFCITPEPPDRPSSGSLFLFDRKVLRYFRKDGHNWRKKKDGKTVKEAHERLKAGSIDVLHCYYAHGEENRNFQRRSYWMLEEELSHIVFVHYQEVKGNGTNFTQVGETGVIPDHGHTVEELSTSECSAASHIQPCDQQIASHVTDTTSFNSTWASEYEDAESAYRHQASPGFQIQKLRSPVMQNTEVDSVPYYPVPISNDYSGQLSISPGLSLGSVAQEEKDTTHLVNGLTYEFQEDIEFPSWGNVVTTRTSGSQSINFQSSDPFIQPSEMRIMLGHGNELRQVFNGAFDQTHDLGRNSNIREEWQDSNRDSIHISERSVDQKSDGNLNLGKAKFEPSEQPPWYDLVTEVNDVDPFKLGNSTVLCDAYPTEQSGKPMHDYFETQASNSGGSSLKVEEKTYYPPLKQPLFDGIIRDGLKKLDSFDRWMSKELGDVTDLGIQSDSGAYWEIVGNEVGIDGSGISNQVPLDNYTLAPSLSQDQFISILEFSPNWAYSGSEVKVLVRGKFLRSRDEVEKFKWACMFGELEVPAEIVADDVLCCHTPLHNTGRVPFYITCSNRLACSEVREFEFRSIRDEDLVDDGSITSYETLLHTRFRKLLSLAPPIPENSIQINEAETSLLCGKVNSLLKDDTEWEHIFNLTKQDELSADKVNDQLLQKLLKEKLHAWLLQKVTEGGKGPSVLDEEGQGVLHFAAALGYDWAIPPTLAAGISVNFRDVNGWTALHWAACYGRERTVALLISLGAAPGVLTDPTPEYPSGRTPADLASRNGHKGISGYLAEATLSSHLVMLKLKDTKESVSTEKAVATVSERTATPVGYGDLPHGLSLKDSLAAVRNATQAVARIHQVFRAQSFQRKQLKEYGDSEFGMSDERALSLLALKTNKARQNDEPVQSAAIRIQNKFRSWKGRKDYLLIRQRVIKIQAHVRGHQVRRSYYKKIIWTVGIVDKVVLRWRRKGKGLSGFNANALAAANTSMQDNETKKDDYDFLKEGRKQTEERFQKALDRVKSMVQYPEARDQYRRLLNVVSEIQETKAAHEDHLNNPDADFDDLIDLEALLEDDAFMDATF